MHFVIIQFQTCSDKKTTTSFIIRDFMSLWPWNTVKVTEGNYEWMWYKQVKFDMHHWLNLHRPWNPPCLRVRYARQPASWMASKNSLTPTHILHGNPPPPKKKKKKFKASVAKELNNDRKTVYASFQLLSPHPHPHFFFFTGHPVTCASFFLGHTAKETSQSKKETG